MTKKFFVLDTNILLNSPNALYSFDDNIVIITEAVLEELDSFKRNKDDIGINARATARILEELRQQGSLIDGIIINNKNGILKIEVNHKDIELPDNWNIDKADHRILQVCKALKENGNDVHLVTNDILLRIKSDIIGVPAEGFETEQSPVVDEQYTGRMEVYISDEGFIKFYQNGELALDDVELKTYDEHGNSYKYSQPIYPHEFILMRNDSTNQTAIGKIDNQCKYIKKLEYDNYAPFGLNPKNVVQRFMIESLMSDIPLAILKGPAGTAKTLISIAAGLDHVVECSNFRKVLLCRPAVSMGEDLGYLPGDEKEKISPYMRSALDNLEILVDSSDKERYTNESKLNSNIQYILDKGYIDMQAISFLRGRSINKQYVIVDEAQNLSVSQARAIVTRIGEGTKLILCGDPNQIDTPFLDSTNNGLSYISERMKGSPYCIQVTAKNSECVRSKLAEDAINRLK